MGPNPCPCFGSSDRVLTTGPPGKSPQQNSCSHNLHQGLLFRCCPPSATQPTKLLEPQSQKCFWFSSHFLTFYSSPSHLNSAFKHLWRHPLLSSLHYYHYKSQLSLTFHLHQPPKSVFPHMMNLPHSREGDLLKHVPCQAWNSPKASPRTWNKIQTLHSGLQGFTAWGPVNSSSSACILPPLHFTWLLWPHSTNL